MSFLPADLAHRLRSIDAGFVDSNNDGLDRYAVDGKVPAFRCVPETPEQIGMLLRTCTEAGAAVVPWGGGTAMRLGNIPSRADVVVDLGRFDRVIEHDAANLTATGQAGVPLSTFQGAVRGERQFLAIDPPHPSRATLGGLVAANSNGPRRMLYGGVRDVVIGMKMVLATGESVKAGGKVVKNVAGYDMCKLVVGSLGTLGIITEVTLRLTPLPETAATLVTTGSLTKNLELVELLFYSALQPAGIALLSPDLAKTAGLADSPSTLAIWSEGFEEAVARHVQEITIQATRIGLAGKVLRGDAHARLWERVQDFGTAEGDLVIRVIVPVGAVGTVVTAIDQWAVHEQRASYVAHAGSGTIWVSLAANPTSAAWFGRLATLAGDHQGHAVMTAAPPQFKAGVDVWGPAPPSFPLMREVKQQFDPHRILNPGRFIAGL
jgi:glycolate oxidase FAD binding subunit